MRVIRIILALAAIALGVVLGALNAQPILVDLGLVQWPTTLGVALLAALLSGVVLGGLILSICVIAPLRQQLRQARLSVVPAATTATTVLAIDPAFSTTAATALPIHSMEP